MFGFMGSEKSFYDFVHLILLDLSLSHPEASECMQMEDEDGNQLILCLLACGRVYAAHYGFMQPRQFVDAYKKNSKNLKDHVDPVLAQFRHAKSSTDKNQLAPQS